MRLHRNTFLTAMLLAAMLIMAPSAVKSQILNEKTKKKIHVGVGMFTDIYIGMPSGVKTRTINQGFHALVAYRLPFGKSNFGFGVGLQVSVHNMFGNFTVDSYIDSTRLVRIPDSISYKRSKLVMPYLELPIEFGFATKSKFACGIGFKVGYMFPAHTKYVGDDFAYPHDELRVKYRNVLNLDRFAYGPTLRVGYKWFHLYGYYQLSSIFQKGKGPDVYPITIGFFIRPF